MKNKLLSICIPTYNRAHYLDESLSSLGSQFNGSPDLLKKVEIVISDNASPDNTAEVVAEHQKKYSNIKYFRNDKNLGADKNYINSVLRATGEYGWIMGDDDFVVNGGINFVVDFLKNNKVLMLTFGSKTYKDKSDAQEKNISIKKEKIYFSNSHDDFFQKGYCVGVLCTMIFNRDIWINTDRTAYKEAWSYYEIALKMLAQSKQTSAHLDFPLVITREDCNWVKNGAELFSFLGWKQLLAQLPNYGYEKKFINSELKIFPNRLFIILLRAKGHDLNCSLQNYKLIFFEFKKYPARLFLATLLYLAPNSIIKIIRDFNKKFIKIKI
jgi:abequosyltransferase